MFKSNTKASGNNEKLDDLQNLQTNMLENSVNKKKKTLVMQKNIKKDDKKKTKTEKKKKIYEKGDKKRDSYSQLQSKQFVSYNTCTSDWKVDVRVSIQYRDYLLDVIHI